MNSFISFSGGVESSTMCILFGNKSDAIFSDTGFEHKEIYKRIDLVESFVQKTIRSSFKAHRIKAKNTLIEQIRTTKFYPSFRSRFCTGEYKIKPIDKFLSYYNEVELLIGLNANEQERTGNHGNKKNIRYRYPLIEKNLSRENCKDILEAVNLEPNFPAYMKRGGCIGCYYKSIKEFEALALLNPEEFKVVEDLEEELQDRREKFFSIKERKSMKQIRKSTENMIFKPEEIYPIINDTTNCGVFCNR